MKKKLYFVTRCIRCGEMPLFLIFYETRSRQRAYCVMICNFKNLKLLLKQRRGFDDPSKYGQVLFTSREEQPGELLKSILKERYDFDLDHCDINEVKLVGIGR